MSDDYEGLEYLQAGFDPASLTVPRLRSILVSHDIDYPSAAKKPQLIQIFSDQLVPQARKILSARARARRTSKGIVDAASQESTVTEDGVEEEPMPPPPTPRTTRRKASRVRTEEPDLPVTRARSPTKRATRVKSEESEPELPVARTRSPTKRSTRPKHPRNSDTETGTDPEQTVRKSRKSEAPTPVAPARKIKPEDSDDGVGVSKRRESAFTSDNPFQSGSSPMSESRSVSGDRRRTLGNNSSTRKSTSSTRRRTDRPKVDDGIHPPTSAKFEIPVSKLDNLGDFDENRVEASEEFTPEEQMELVRERAVNGVDALGPRRPKRQQTQGFNKRLPILLLLLTLLGGYATWYRQEKVAVGYCGVGRDAVQIIPDGVEVPKWARVLVEPQCEPCPQHAYCSGNLETSCEVDFVLKLHPLSVCGLVPLTPSCEPDGEKARRIQSVADRAIEELRKRRAKFECGDLTGDAGSPAPTVDISDEVLKQVVNKKRKKAMSEEEFEKLWAGAVQDIKGRNEVVSNVDGNRTIFYSTSLAGLPFSCSVKRSIRLALARHRLEIATMTILTLLGLYGYYTVRSRAADNAAIPHLVSLTLDRLANQASLHAQDRESYPEGWISIGQLRDDVLRDQHSLRKREALWNKVKRVLEMNANIRSSQRESRSGEISRVWEWIGAVGGLESGEKRRKSGRVSWGAYNDASSPVSGNDGGPEIVQMKWQEGRPIY
ncbi:sister chromatid separation protein-like protein [Amylocarpus encephaloides]|uniref:Sister chromatid separation protein-like protein n=1 Tax=Amylocarpus encephaloides TaxID=45428 RepID=A0A9P7YS60_9HELO|nr:sister chromatid separation protein-like protein [Amylocarpus encephaloides]